MAATMKKIDLDDVRGIVGRALLDAEFRAKLQDDARGTLMILGLDSSAESVNFFKALVSQTFQAAAAEVDNRLGGRPVIALWL